jgi:hypothetical protein
MNSSYSSLRSMLLAAVVAFGITTVWFVLVIWLFSMTEQSQVALGNYEQLYVRLDGVPVIVKQTNGGQSRQVLSLDRQPTTGDVYQILYPAYVSPAGSGPSLVSSRDWTNRLAAISDGGSPATYWYLVHDGRANGLAYGVGYNSATKQAIGYFSREGFSERLPPREAWFQVKGDTGLAYATPERTFHEPYFFSQPSQFLLANNKLWQIDTRKRTVKSLLDCPAAEGIGWAWRTSTTLPSAAANSPQQQAATAPRSLFVRSADAAMIVDQAAGDVQRYPLPANLQAKTLAAFQLADERLLLAASPLVAGQDQLVVWIDPEGKAVEKQFAMDSLNRGSTDETTMSIVSAVAAPALVWQVLMVVVLMLQKLALGEAHSMPAAIRQAITICWPGIALVLAFSITSAVAAYRRQRRFGLPGAIGWAILSFIFGLPGWIAYRWHRTWPVLDECPSCDQPAPRDREACTECGAAFPPPELKGLEVFA